MQYLALHSRHAFFNGMSSVVQAQQLGFGGGGGEFATSFAGVFESIVSIPADLRLRNRQSKQEVRMARHDMI